MASPSAKSYFLAAALMLAQPGYSAPVRDQRWSLLTGRLFPTLNVLDRALGTKGTGSPILDKTLDGRHRRADGCLHVPKCLVSASIWADTEIDELSSYAARVLKLQSTQTTAPDDGVKAQVTRELRGLNGILRVYGLGSVPRDPRVDGPVDVVGSAQFNATVADAVNLSDAAADDPTTALDPSMALALALLDVNDRGEAIAFEPLDTNYNAAALARAKNIDWKQYRYTAVIVLGNGPNDLSTPLSARGKLRIRVAASRFADGLAPFLIVTGGSVHPRGSKFVEALEMRKALVERFGISADAIVVEPYARYTETNFRNATRRLIALGAPLNRDALIVTDTDHTLSIESPEFMNRAHTLLGYQPGAIGSRVSPYELLFRPASVSLRVDPSDPLDP